jgi:hypothetical protein
MAKKDRPGESEFGGKGGILQRTEDGHSSFADTAADSDGVREAAMVVRRAGRMDGYAEFKETRNPDTKMIDIEVVPYSEEQARRELEERH